jgi:hypothetical protein
MAEIRNEYETFDGKRKREKSLGRLWRRWEDVKMDPRETRV